MPKYNPLIFSGLDLTGGGPAGAVQWKPPVPTEADLILTTGGPGEARVVIDTQKIYVWDSGAAKWVDTTLTIDDVGAVPSDEGMTLSLDSSGAIVRRTLVLEPADATHPGIITTTAQSLAGEKTFTDSLTAQGSIDAQAGIDSSTGTLDIGSSTTTINIGNAGSTITISGTTLYESVTDLLVQDKTITLNDGGGVTSAGDSGIEIEEASLITGYAKVSSDRDSWELKAPNTAGVATVSPGALGIVLDQSSHDPLTLTAVGATPSGEGASLSGQALTLQPADSSYPGVVSTTIQSFAGDKTFDDDVTVDGILNAPQIRKVLGIDFSPDTSGIDFRTDGSQGVGSLEYGGSGPLDPTLSIQGFDGISLSDAAGSGSIKIKNDIVTIEALGNPQIDYDVAVSADWDSPAPTKVHTALDDLAARFVQQNDVTNEPTGFVNRTSSVLSFSDSSPARTFTITPVGSFTFYVKGKKFTKTVTEMVQIPDSLGDHYIYYNDAGTLLSTQDILLVPTIIQQYAFVSVVYWNNETSSHTYFADERHGLTMDGATHGYLHTVFGARYLSGFALQNFFLTAVGGGPKFDVDIGSFRDEDILHSISPITTQIPILYRFGANNGWRKKAKDTYPVIYQGSTVDYPAGVFELPYNEYTGSAWTLTEVQAGKYVLVHIFATNDIDNPIVGIQGTDEHDSISAAKNAANTEITQLSGLPFTEFVPLGSVVFQTNTASIPAPTYSVIQQVDGANYVDFRGTQLYTPAGEATTHGLLSGLGNDDHIQYLLVDGSRQMASALNMGTHAVINVIDPTNPQDAATKAYTDAKVSDIAYGPSWDTVTGIAPSKNAVYDVLVTKQDAGSYITALTSDVAASGPGSVVATIQPNVVTNSKLAQMAASTIKGNATAGLADPQDLSASDVRTLISVLPDYSGDIARTPFTFLNNTTADITGLSFSTLTVQGFDCQLTVSRGTQFAQYTIRGIQKSASWELSQEYVGDETGLVFFITTGGQMRYTSDSSGLGGTILFKSSTV